uniref:Protein kinase-like domain, concanavalin A-like lectin/glucanase domain protein n=1 Tax=Tanacetum cinerariifolium TaxID=118510 RepID=A0A699H067_TANCI|nr:protein kinase-like domain, concanavalin A-like lectin/glucanase domain protein [Tanacetum cinerariifolium]
MVEMCLFYVDRMAAMGMWFDRISVTSIGYNFGKCFYIVGLGCRMMVVHFLEFRDHVVDVCVHAAQRQMVYCTDHVWLWVFHCRRYSFMNMVRKFSFLHISKKINRFSNANPCSTPNREFLYPKKKKEIESWLKDSRIVDSLDGSDEIEYFNTFLTLEELEYHEWLLKYPKPSWVKAKIRIKNLNNIKISCKMGHFLERQAYIDLESLINVMSRQHYNGIMNKGLESRQKPSNPSKSSNFIGRVRGLKVFIGNYECNFMILEDTTSIIDHQLGEVVFRKPFARTIGLVYDQMSHKMEVFNHINFKDMNTDSIPPFVLRSNDDRRKTYYSDCLTLGPELYLMRRSLEVLRKFHGTILGGRFNQLSHVSSPLLIKQGEY